MLNPHEQSPRMTSLSSGCGGDGDKDALDAVALEPVGPRAPGATDHHIASLGALVAELSEAHLDTIGMARNHDLGFDWESHIEYLQRLRRLSEVALANTTVRYAMIAIPSPSLVEAEAFS
jgi:hypothetical protein